MFHACRYFATTAEKVAESMERIAVYGDAPRLRLF